jgi:hypothetical protein
MRSFRNPIHASALLAALCLTGCGPEQPAVSISTTPTSVQQPVSDDELLRRIDEALDITYARKMSVERNAAWQIVHGAVAFKRDLIIEHEGKPVRAVDYALGGGQMKGWKFEPGVMLGERRGLRSIMEPGSKEGQGHPDQWFGYLSGCGLPPDQPFVVGNETFTLADLAAQVEYDVPRALAREYSWTLMGLSAYRPSDYKWTASDGKKWSIEKLLDIECDHDLSNSACGGSHRLVGITLTLNRHHDQGGRLEGAWKKADDKVQAMLAKARQYQNPDGSFSVNYFSRPGRSADLAQSLGTTGHTLEFVVLASSDEQLREPWVRRAVVYLCDVFKRTRNVDLECGGLYHSASGLLLYRERMFGPRSFGPEQVAGND